MMLHLEVQKLFLLTPLVPNMVEMTKNLVEQAKKAKVSHIVKQSVFVLDPEYGITANKLHSQAEKIVQSSCIDYTFLRPASFMQNYLSFSDSIKKRGTFYQPLGDSKTSFVDTRNIAAVAVAALTKSREHKNKAYDITGPVAISNYEIAEILSDVAGKKITYVDFSDSVAQERMRNAAMQEWTINSLTEMFIFQKADKASLVSHDMALVTGQKPISFAQFAKDYVESFKL